MKRTLFGLTLLSLMIGLVGCGKGTTKMSDAEIAAKTDAAVKETIAKNLAALAPEDREAALQQKICPVTKSDLGSMEGIYKFEYQGKTYFLCCEGCKKEFDKDPEAYIAKLAGAVGTYNK